MAAKNTDQNSPFDSLQADLLALNTFIKTISEKHNLSENQITELLKQKNLEAKTPHLIPSSILKNKQLGILEAVTKYLKEEFKLTYKQIATLLNRDQRVVWVTYNKATKKISIGLKPSEPTVWLPVSIFSRGLGPMQAIASYLHDDMNMSFKQIADLLDRDNRTIWSCYNKPKRDEHS